MLPPCRERRRLNCYSKSFPVEPKDFVAMKFQGNFVAVLIISTMALLLAFYAVSRSVPDGGYPMQRSSWRGSLDLSIEWWGMKWLPWITRCTRMSRESRVYRTVVRLQTSSAFILVCISLIPTWPDGYKQGMWRSSNHRQTSCNWEMFIKSLSGEHIVTKSHSLFVRGDSHVRTRGRSQY